MGILSSARLSNALMSEFIPPVFSLALFVAALASGIGRSFATLPDLTSRLSFGGGAACSSAAMIREAAAS
jgi:hypothetical protein